MKARICYIDAIKGLAILLMIMGHVIARQFPDWQYALNETPRGTMYMRAFDIRFFVLLDYNNGQSCS